MDMVKTYLITLEEMEQVTLVIEVMTLVMGIIVIQHLQGLFHL